MRREPKLRYYGSMVNPSQILEADPELALVEADLRERAGRSDSTVTARFGRIVRQAIDEVVDGPRTGRWSTGQLGREEKAYIGTKVEIITRSELELEPSDRGDAVAVGVDFEIKWSGSGQWMIGPENFGRICLGYGLNPAGGAFSVGLFRARTELLRPGRNRDRKTSLLASALASDVHWFVRGAPLPVNFVAELPDDIRSAVFAERSAQDRVRKLAELMPMVPIPRQAFSTVARNKADPMRRLRQDKSKVAVLGNMRLLSWKFGKAKLEALGLQNVPKDHWVAVPEDLLRGITE